MTLSRLSTSSKINYNSINKLLCYHTPTAAKLGPQRFFLEYFADYLQFELYFVDTEWRTTKQDMYDMNIFRFHFYFMAFSTIFTAPTLHDALVAGASAFGMVLISKALPFINQALTQSNSDAKVLAQVLALMDTLLMGRVDLKFGSIDIMVIAKEATESVARTTSLTEAQVANLIKRAAELWSMKIFSEKGPLRGQGV